jgi:hypothetical protein
MKRYPGASAMPARGWYWDWRPDRPFATCGYYHSRGTRYSSVTLFGFELICLHGYGG